MNIADSTILVTGATDGVGKVVAKRLAESGAHVLVHGRNADKCAATVGEIRQTARGSRVEWYRADLASLGEVQRLADEILAAQDRLTVLINNAGVGFGAPGSGREISRDGYELRFAVNYLAPFLLTHELLPLLRRSTPSRIVNVASVGQAPIDFDDVMLSRGYDGRRAYGQSKLALIMFTFDLAAALAGTGVTVNAVHPATLMNTKMVSQAGIAPRTSVEQGADAIVHLATSHELGNLSGRFLDGRREAEAHPDAYDAHIRQRLRRLSVESTGVPINIAR
jgi:NAD(P)-dependent dehydrogenase (short-subunit alcohol dehydrogenase family)